MRYRDSRETLLKGIDTPDVPDADKPATLASPRWLSPFFSGSIIARELGKLDLIQVPKRRVVKRRSRQRVPGVGIRRARQPWKV